ncbi:helix-turn-helix transcriptional regulator [Acidovorax sp. CCYZU-2555]|uniref:AraC family transcriptional regulator n=1 Tax=Acidovorax sp. CCYZU-2555 TaxID=2835042 RepID=UPI001BCE0CB9|nr:helix-turn-helix transcriptional regulator [Acidovorax sp. CCYZU-2555]MBS7779837.1 helix-turn-helix transcriptional regulator [Acidovorax sp. CCYZU-2555]
MPKPPAALLSSPAVRKLARPLSYVATLDPHLYEPSARRPVRSKMRELRRDTQVMPHSHPWAQMAISMGGVIRLSMDHATYIVPPNRAVWVPPGLPHAVTMVETARLYTLYFLPARDGAGAPAEWMEQPAWQQCRVLQVSELLRALVQELSTDSDAGPPLSPQALQREHHLSALVCDELRRAHDMRLGIVMPRDKRLQHLCEAVLEQPTRHASLQEWALDTGASLRTVARLFHSELGCTFTQWRQQVVLAHAVALAARQMPIAHIAAELNYTPSAFSAMVRRSVGMTAAAFLGQHQLQPSSS